MAWRSSQAREQAQDLRSTLHYSNDGIWTFMCGIVGYVGKQQTAPIILEGLQQLEYHGYDSAGISMLKDHDLRTRKKKSKIDEGLARLIQAEPLDGFIGLGHTR